MTEHLMKTIEKSIVPILIIAIVVLGYFLFVKENSQTGVFEYVRKANQYMDQHKYSKAISLLDKAYKISPDNKQLKKEIVYAYISYIRELDKKDQIDDAIVIMHKAYKISPHNSNTIQNLAILYIQKAISLANNQDLVLANTYLKKSVELSMVSSAIRRNISNYLYNKAIEEDNKDNTAIALACLKASFSLWERAEALRMLGYIYHSKSDQEMATFYWTKALESGIEDEDLQVQLEIAKRDLEVKYKLKAISSNTFNIKMYKDYEIDTLKFTQMFSDIYDGVGQDLGVYPQKGVSIIIYDEEDFRYVYNKPGIVQGFFDGSIKIPLRFDTDQAIFKAIIAHEYTHSLVSILTQRKAPVWLNEGIACFEQSKYEVFDVDLLRAYINKGNRIELSMLENGFGNMDDHALLALSYQGSYGVVNFIIAKWGFSGLKGFLARIKDGRHYLNAIDEQFFVSPATFEKMANEYIKSMVNA